MEFEQGVYLGAWPSILTDVIAANHPTGKRKPVEKPSIIQDDDRPAVEFDGAADSGLEIASLRLYPQWSDQMLFWFYAAPTKMMSHGVIVGKDDGVKRPPGGWSLEDREHEGKLWLDMYWRDSTGKAVWFANGEGIIPREVGRPDLIMIKREPGMITLWVNGVLAGGLEVESAQASNAAPLCVGKYADGSAPWAGRMQGMTLIGGVVTDDELTDFPPPAPPFEPPVEPPVDPVDPVEPGPPPTGTFPSLSECSGPLVNLPTDGSMYRKTLPGGARCDAHRGGKPLVWKRKLNTGNYQIPLYVSGAKQGCWAGGAVIGTQPENQPRSYNTFGNSPAFLLGRDSALDGYVIEGLVVENYWDAFKLDRKASGITLRGAYARWIRDDFIENDDRRPNLRIEDTLVDGCFVFFSSRNNSSLSAVKYTTTLKQIIVHMVAMELPKDYPPGLGTKPGHGYCFKLDKLSEQFVVEDSLFAWDRGASDKGASSQEKTDPLYDLKRYDRLRNSARNTICWLGKGEYPGAWWRPPGFTILAGDAARNRIEKAKKDWLRDHPLIYSV